MSKQNIRRILFAHKKLLRPDPLNEWFLRQQRPLKVNNWCYPLQPEQTRNLQCCKSGSRIRDQGSGVFLVPGFAIWDPVSGSGIGKKSGSRSGIRIRDGKPWSYFWELRNHFFWLKYLNSLMCIRDPGSVMEKIQIWDQGSRMEKSGSRIQDPGWKKLGSGIQDPRLNIPDQQNRKFCHQIC